MSIARSVRRGLTTLAAALLLAAALVPSAATPAAADSGADFIAMANGYRASQGIGPVAFHSALDQIATERGVQISEPNGFYHDFDYLKDRFDDFGICWRSFGEIIALNGSGSVSSFGSQWWNSPTHKGIMLGTTYPFTHAGGSRHQAGGTWYGVMVFVQLCGASVPPVQDGTFSDIGNSLFRAEIEWLVSEEIAAGCTPTKYCPINTVTRAQMASFLKRAMNLPPASRDYFADDGSSIHEDDINRLTEAGVTSGCGGNRYCPSAYVSRAEMASFLVRALGLPSTSTDYFWDDDGSMHEESINRLASAGIVDGCGSGRFCPGWGVSREQMAAFVERAFR